MMDERGSEGCSAFLSGSFIVIFDDGVGREKTEKS